MSKVPQEKLERPDACPGCLGLLRGAKIKFNLKDQRECRECNVYNGVSK